MLWNDSLLIGMDKIDNQHRELVSRVEQVLAAGRQGRGASEVGKTLVFLQEYVVQHFKDEEALQKACGYPKYAAHKAKHDRFVRQVQNLIDRYRQAGPTLDVVMTTNKTVVDWLVGHINTEDKDFAMYYKEKTGKKVKKAKKAY